MLCKSCNASFVSVGQISGIVHEKDCPDSYKTEIRECKWCGQDFVPEVSFQDCCCEECARAYIGL